MFAGLLEVGFLGATVAFDGEARLRCAKTQYLLGVGRLQCGLAAAEVPADQLYRKAAAQNDSCRLGVAPNVVLGCGSYVPFATGRSEEHTSELQSRLHLVCRLLLEKKKTNTDYQISIGIVSYYLIPFSSIHSTS